MLLFLGAGASRAFGIPTMPEFIGIFDQEFGGSELYVTVKHGLADEGDLESIMTVLSDLSKPVNALLETISPHTFRVIDSYSSAAYRHKLLNESSIKEEAGNLVAQVKRIIRRECLTAVDKKKVEILQAYDRLFVKLGQRYGGVRSGDGTITIPTNEIRVFTTNYDTCFETWFNARQIEFSQGIIRRFGEEIFSSSYYNGNRRLYKLHGSIDCFIRDGTIRRLPAFAHTDGVLTFSGMPYGDEYLFYPIDGSGYGHVLTAPFLAMMSDFRGTADVDGVWLIIGSSLRDRTISSTLNDVLQTHLKGSSLKIALLDPGSELTIDRLRQQGFTTLADAMTPITQEFPTQAAIDKVDEVLSS